MFFIFKVSVLQRPVTWWKAGGDWATKFKKLGLQVSVCCHCNGLVTQPHEATRLFGPFKAKLWDRRKIQASKINTFPWLGAWLYSCAVFLWSYPQKGIVNRKYLLETRANGENFERETRTPVHTQDGALSSRQLFTWRQNKYGLF